MEVLMKEKSKEVALKSKVQGAQTQKDERAELFERVDGLMAIRRTDRCSESTEMAGFLAIFHPELSEEKRAELALAIVRKDRKVRR
jgi:hypothetical protein